MKPFDLLCSGSPMARCMKLSAVFSVVLAVVFAFLHQTALTVTAATIAYHLLMRLAAGYVFDKTLNNHVDYHHRWFQLHSFEEDLYELLRVRNWKTNLPTYEPDLFDRHQHSWEEIAQAMCQAELVHEVIVVLSFLPVLASVWLGDAPVFIITSVCSAAFDMLFVIIQRYNRPRILQIISKLKERA